MVLQLSGGTGVVSYYLSGFSWLSRGPLCTLSWPLRNFQSAKYQIHVEPDWTNGALGFPCQLALWVRFNHFLSSFSLMVDGTSVRQLESGRVASRIQLVPTLSSCLLTTEPLLGRPVLLVCCDPFHARPCCPSPCIEILLSLQGPTGASLLCGVLPIAQPWRMSLNNSVGIILITNIGHHLLALAHFPYHLWDSVLTLFPGSLPTTWPLTSLLCAQSFLLQEYCVLCSLVLSNQ